MLNRLSKYIKIVVICSIFVMGMIGFKLVYSDLLDSGYLANFTGTGYHIDSENGNDANPGTRSSPWKTIAKAASSTLASGDAVLLKCGGLWRESTVFPSQSYSAGNILIGAYGDCADKYPTISGATIISEYGTSTWNRATSSLNIYSLDFDLKATPTALFINGKELILSRYPNFTNYEKELLLISAEVPGSPNTQFYVRPDEKIYFTTNNPVGSNIYIRNTSYISQKRKVAAFDNITGKITLDSPTSYPMYAGMGYLIENNLSELDSNNEWYYDSTNRKLYVYLESYNTGLLSYSLLEAVPENKSGTNILLGFYSNVPKIRMEHIKLEKGINGVFVDSNNSSIKDLDVSYMYNNGIFLAGNAASSTVENSRVDHVQEMGIRAECNYCTVNNNIVTNTGLTYSPITTYAGIIFPNQVNGNAVIKNNLVASSSYIGILFSARGDLAEKNIIKDSCLRLSDCGAIYSGGASSFSSTIRDNIIENVKTVSYGGAGVFQAIGIYLDDDATNFKVINNTISNADYGIFIHNAFSNTIASNTVFQSNITAFNSQYDFPRATPVGANNVYDNIFVIKKGGKSMLWTGDTAANTFSTGQYKNTLSNNIIIDPENKYALYGVPGIGLISSAYYNNLTNGIEKKSFIYPKLFTEPATNSPEIITNGNFENGSISPWSKYSQNNLANISLATSTGCNGLYCLKLNSAGDGDGLAISGTFLPALSGVSSVYNVKYKIKNVGLSDGAFSAALLSAVNYSGKGYGTNRYNLAKGEEIYFNDIFTSSTTTDGLRLDFDISPNSSFIFDDVSLKLSPQPIFFDIDKMSNLINNPSLSNKSVNCSDLSFSSCDLIYDETGYAVEFPVNILPYKSKIFFQENESLRRIDGADFLPSKPSILSIFSGTSTALVTWNPPATLGNATSSTYSLQYRKLGDALWKVNTIKVENQLSSTISQLNENTNYEMRVISHTKEGNSLPSAATTTKTKTSITPPSSPPSNTIISSGGPSYSGSIFLPQITINQNSLNSIKVVAGLNPDDIVVKNNEDNKSKMIIMRGDKGKQVTELQKFLIKEKVLFLPKNTKLGIYGIKTEKALKAFQCANKIVCSGYSWGKLDEKTNKAISNLER